MNLRAQPRKNYNVFATDGMPSPNEIVMLQFADASCSDVDEVILSEHEAEWVFLMETMGEQMGWKQGQRGKG